MINQNFTYPFQLLEEKYIFIKHYNRSDSLLREFFILVAPEKRPLERMTFRFVQYFYCWRIMTGPLLFLYKKTLKMHHPILVHQQFSVYAESVYLETYWHYSGIIDKELQHLCIDFDSVFFEIIIVKDLHYTLCLGESLLPYEE